MKFTEIIKFFKSGSALPIFTADENKKGSIKLNKKLNDEFIDLNSLLIEHPFATFFARVSGESQFAGISSGDIVVVDTAIEPKEGNTVCVASKEDIFLKRLILIEGKEFLETADGDIEELNPDKLFENKILGTVTKIIHTY